MGPPSVASLSHAHPLPTSTPGGAMGMSGSYPRPQANHGVHPQSSYGQFPPQPPTSSLPMAGPRPSQPSQSHPSAVPMQPVSQNPSNLSNMMGLTGPPPSTIDNRQQPPHQMYVGQIPSSGVAAPPGGMGQPPSTDMGQAPPTDQQYPSGTGQAPPTSTNMGQAPPTSQQYPSNMGQAPPTGMGQAPPTSQQYPLSMGQAPPTTLGPPMSAGLAQQHPPSSQV